MNKWDNPYYANSYLRVLSTLEAKQLYIACPESDKVVNIPISDVIGINAEFGEYCDFTIRNLGIVPIECIFTNPLPAQVFLRKGTNIQIVRVQPEEYALSEIEFSTCYYSHGDNDPPNRGGTN